jgi:hypothetical protein
MHGKLAANARLNFAVICSEKLAEKWAKSLQQRRGKGRNKNSAGRGKIVAKILQVTTKSRQNVAANSR